MLFLDQYFKLGEGIPTNNILNQFLLGREIGAAENNISSL
jgi:hypothetical protein